QTLYDENTIQLEFLPLLDNHEQCVREKAAILASSETADNIRSFIDRAADYLGIEGVNRFAYATSQQMNRSLDRIAELLCSNVDPSTVVQDFIYAELARKPSDIHANFVVACAANWVTGLRARAPDSTAVLVKKLLDLCSDDALRLRLLVCLYDRIWDGRHGVTPTPGERKLIRDSAGLFSKMDSLHQFIRLIALTFPHDWQEMRSAVDETIAKADHQANILEALVQSTYAAIVRGPENHSIPLGFSEWLVSKLLGSNMDKDFGKRHRSNLWAIFSRIGGVRLGFAWNEMRRTAMRNTGSAKCNGAFAMQLNEWLIACIRPIDEDDVGQQDSKSAVTQILQSTALDDSTCVYRYPEIARQFDPIGHIVPSVIAELSQSVDPNAAWRLARIAQVYELNSEPWRKIAISTMNRATSSNSRGLDPIYNVLAFPYLRNNDSLITNQAIENRTQFANRLRGIVDDEEASELQPFWKSTISAAETTIAYMKRSMREELDQ
ncbi:MAG: hypothetical protein FWD57_07760, partial [Polyangiaceae bacterium]|nr:hypothetical protein [Polyangiaceae bacterium]